MGTNFPSRETNPTAQFQMTDTCRKVDQWRVITSGELKMTIISAMISSESFVSNHYLMEHLTPNFSYISLTKE